MCVLVAVCAIVVFAWVNVLHAERRFGRHGHLVSVEGIDLHYADGHLNFSLTDQDGNFIHPEQVKVALTRPVGVDEDRELELVRDNNVYRVDNDVPSGVWNALISATIADAAPFEYRARLLVDK